MNRSEADLGWGEVAGEVNFPGGANSMCKIRRQGRTWTTNSFWLKAGVGGGEQMQYHEDIVRGCALYPGAMGAIEEPQELKQ